MSGNTNEDKKPSLDERIEALGKQMEEAKAIVLKCMGAIEVLSALKEEEEPKE